MPEYNLNAVLNSIEILTSELTLDEMCHEFVKKVVRLLDLDGGTVFRFQQTRNSLKVLADYLAPHITTPFGDTSHLGAVYPLDSYPTIAQALQDQVLLTIYIDESAGHEAEEALLAAFQWYGMMVVPMVCRGKIIGLLNLYISEENEHRFTKAGLELAQALANHAALAIEDAELKLDTYEGQFIAEAMQAIGRILASELDYHRVVHNVAEFAHQLINAQFVYIAVPDQDEFRLEAIARHDPDTPIPVARINETLTLNHPPVLQAVQEKRPVVEANIQVNAPLWPEEVVNSPWRSAVAVPLLAHERLVGVLAAYAYEPDYFGFSEIALLMSLASQAAIAIQNARLFSEIEAQREALHQVSLRLVNAQEEERRRISRELHDELGQALTALKINLDVIRRSLPGDVPHKLGRIVGEAGALAVQTLESARNLSLELHPAILDDLGLVAALRWEIDRFEQRTGQTVNFKADLADANFRPELEITIYRIITEALTNVARHAQAQTITVSLRVDNNQLSIKIKDDGVGFDAQDWFNSPQKHRSLGLIGMRERAGLLGGQLEVESAIDSGTIIVAQLPLVNLNE